MLQHLRAIGVRIAPDDFGIGFSSLNYFAGFHSTRLRSTDVLSTTLPGAVADRAGGHQHGQSPKNDDDGKRASRPNNNEKCSSVWAARKCRVIQPNATGCGN
jgi:hypothetical protein